MTPDPDCLLDQNRLDAVIAEATRCAQLGDLAEFGVFKGGTAIHLARIATAAGRKLHLFDSWQGLSAPTLPTERNLIGVLASPKEYCVEKLKAAGVLECCVFHDGDIGEIYSLPVLPYAFAHIDVDMYHQTSVALVWVTGALTDFDKCIIVDDYNNPKFSGVQTAVDIFLKLVKKSSVRLIGEPPNRSIKIIMR